MTLLHSIDIVSASTGEMNKRYGFVYVDKQNDGSGTLERKKKEIFLLVSEGYPHERRMPVNLYKDKSCQEGWHRPALSLFAKRIFRN